jgi:urease accessory protein
MTANIFSQQKDRGTAGWLAQLELEIACRKGKSIVSRSRQQGPLTIQKPFYPEEENDICHLYVLHPPAGIVGGDTLELDVTACNRGSVLLTTPGATKFYRSNSSCARQHQHFSIAEGSSLEWLPQETIYYPDAHAQVKTSVDLEDNGSFIGWDIHCLGLPVNNLNLGNGQVETSLSVRRNNRPLLLEKLRITPQKHHLQAAFLRDEPVFGSFIATGGNESLLEHVRETLKLDTGGLWGATLVEDLIITRYLGPSVNEARKLFILVWQLLRPAILGRESRKPRIWAT